MGMRMSHWLGKARLTVNGTLDIVLLSQRVHAEPATLVAGALMTVGLLAKTALFPLHLWLPPAHAGAPPPASAVLSSLVVKASFFLLLRLWFDAMPGLMSLAGAQILAVLGSAATLFGSVLALRQAGPSVVAEVRSAVLFEIWRGEEERVQALIRRRQSPEQAVTVTPP